MSRKKKKRAAPEDEVRGDSFTGLFLSLMIILLAFFIVLNTMAVVDDVKKRDAMGSLTGTFGMLPDGHAVTKDGEQVTKSVPMDEKLSLEQMIKDIEVIMGYSKIGDPFEDISFDMLAKYPRIVISGKVLFPHNTIAINPEAFPVLDEIRKTADLLEASLLIQGHSERSVHSITKHPYPWATSAMRANAIMQYFTDTGMDPLVVQAEGFGVSQPVCPNLGPGKITNRRVEIVFIPMGSI